MRHEPQLTESWWDRRTTPEPNSGCLLWTWGTDRDGYGMTYVHGKQTRATRAAYAQRHGPIGHGLCVLHSCDNPACVNTEHLFLGTASENNADRHAKGRDATGDRNGARTQPHRVQRGSAHVSHRRPELRRGEKNGRAVLDETKVSSIIDRLARGASCAALGREFGVSDAQIRHIKTGRQWRWLPRPCSEAR